MTERSSITTAKKTSSSRPTAGSAAKAARRSDNSPAGMEERERLIAMTAYYRAERRGFAPGYELEDWYTAAAEIDRQLGRD